MSNVFERFVVYRSYDLERSRLIFVNKEYIKEEVKTKTVFECFWYGVMV